ncbi:MAG: hypothetical protein K9L59_10245 [Desulfobacterales bacterium]|nr:hypothetical protein [Desulfobacterales bacterium]
MTEQEKKAEREKGGSKKKSPASDDSGADDIKIVELGLMEDDCELLRDISVLLGDTKEQTPSAKEPEAEPAAEPPHKPASARKRQPVKTGAGSKNKRPAATERKNVPSPSGTARGGGGKTASLHRQKLEQARMRSAQAARKTRQKRVGKGVLSFIFIAGLLISLGAAAGFYLFKPEQRPASQKPVKFSVQNAPSIKFQIPAQEPSKAVALNKGEPAAGEPEAKGKDAELSGPEAANTQSVEPETTADPQHSQMPKETASQFLASWAGAWEASAGENGRIDPYISHYSSNFQDGDMDLAAWKADKADKNSRKEWIRIGIDNVRVSGPAADGTVEVRFLQTYESSNYADQTEKTLTLVPEEGKWKILGIGAAPAR